MSHEASERASERAEMKRVRVSRNLIPFADILFRPVEIFAEHSAIKLYANIGNIPFQPMQQYIYILRGGGGGRGGRGKEGIVLKFNIYIRYRKRILLSLSLSAIFSVGRD